MTLASEIRAEMGRNRMSVTDLSQRTGISVSSIRRKIYRESSDISIAELEAIGEVLDIPAWELMRRTRQSCELDHVVA